MPYDVSYAAGTVVKLGQVQINPANQVVTTLQADSIAHATDRTGDNALPQSYPGSLTTRTDADDGVITLEAGHAVITGRVDIYWSGGKRRGVTGTVSGNALTVTLGSGDDLPVQGTAVVACNPAVETAVWVGNDMQTLLVGAADAGVTYQIVVTDGSNVELLLIDEVPYSWVDGSGVTNPLAGDTVGKIYMSHNQVVTAGINVLALKS